MQESQQLGQGGEWIEPLAGLRARITLTTRFSSVTFPTQPVNLAAPLVSCHLPSASGNGLPRLHGASVKMQQTFSPARSLINPLQNQNRTSSLGGNGLAPKRH